MSLGTELLVGPDWNALSAQAGQVMFRLQRDGWDVTVEANKSPGTCYCKVERLIIDENRVLERKLSDDNWQSAVIAMGRLVYGE